MPRHGSALPASSLGDATLLDALLTHTDAGVAAFDDDLRCVRANAAFARLASIEPGARLNGADDTWLAPIVLEAARTGEASGPARPEGTDGVEICAYPIAEHGRVAGVWV